MTETDKIAAALAKAAGGIRNPAKNREVVVKTQGGQSYKFKYATFDAIIDVIRQPLSENGLWFVQTLDGNQMVTTLYHSSGQTLASRIPFVTGGNKPQEMGGALTYSKRYGLCALLGIAADEDDDANSASGNTIAEQKDTSRAPRIVTPPPENAGDTDRDRVIAQRSEAKANSIIDVIREASTLIDATRALMDEGLEDVDGGAWKMRDKSVLDFIAKAAPEHFERIQTAYNAKKGDD